MTIATQHSPSSWPFMIVGHYRAAAHPREGQNQDLDREVTPDADEPDRVENELVKEQLEKDRKASKAADLKVAGDDSH